MSEHSDTFRPSLGLPAPLSLPDLSMRILRSLSPQPRRGFSILREIRIMSPN
jgi:hypothetical protein